MKPAQTCPAGSFKKGYASSREYGTEYIETKGWYHTVISNFSLHNAAAFDICIPRMRLGDNASLWTGS